MHDESNLSTAAKYNRVLALHTFSAEYADVRVTWGLPHACVQGRKVGSGALRRIPVVEEFGWVCVHPRT